MSKQPTLKDEIRDSILLNNIEITWGEIVDGNLDMLIDAILQLISSRLPEKKYILHLTGNEFREAHGFNKCLSEVKAILESKE